MTRWWCSFADPKRARGEQFLGICIVWAADEISAVKVAHALGINPGGEVAFMDIDEAKAQQLSFQLPMDVFIPRDDAKALSARIEAEIGSCS